MTIRAVRIAPRRPGLSEVPRSWQTREGCRERFLALAGQWRARLLPPRRWRKPAWPRPRTLITGLAPLVVLLGLGGFALLALAQRRAEVEEERSRAADLAVLLAEHAGRLLDAADVALLQIATIAQERSWDEIERSTTAYQAVRGLSARL